MVLALRKLCSRTSLYRHLSRTPTCHNTATDVAPLPTSYFNITPGTITEVTAHDIKAASLTKALYIDSLPPSVAHALTQTDTEFHTTFKRKIFETFFFEPAQRQPDRPVKQRKAHDAIVKGLYSEIIKFAYAKVDHNKSKIQVDAKPYFEHSFLRALPDYTTPQPFLINGHLSYNLVSDQPAYPLFTVEQCLQTTEHGVEWDTILRSTLDISPASVLDILVNGASSTCCPAHPYSRVIFDTASAVEWSDTSRARGIYFLFARLASEAIRDGYSPGDVLDVPKLGVYISSSAYSYHFVFYQLNTLDMSSDQGVKNLSWGHSIDQITNPLVKYGMVAPENLLGPEVLHDVCDHVKVSLLYDLPTKHDVYFE